MTRDSQIANKAFCLLSRWLISSLFAIAAALPCAAHAASAPPGLDLTIFLEAGGRWNQKQDPHYRTKWLEACGSLMTLFGNPEGRFGHGPFTSVECLEKPTTLKELAGKRTKPSWTMQVLDNDKQSGIAIYFMGSSRPRPEAIQQGSPSDKFMEGLTHKKVANALALTLEDALPMFTLLRVADDARQIDVESPLLPDPVPEEFVVYTLEFDAAADLWVPAPVGYIKSEDAGLSRDIKWKLRLHEGAFHKGQMLFAHNEQGRGMMQESTGSRLSSLLGRFGVTSLIEGMKTALSQNISGIRYGYPLLPPLDVVGGSKMLSLFTEVRAGPLSGLRLYYDTAPKVTDITATGEKVYFGWSALEVGWAFNLNLPAWLAPVANRLDVQPRAGLITLDSKMVGSDQFGLQWVADFKLDGATVYGLEVGIERDFFKKSLLRGWTGALYSWSALGITETNFLSVRAGLDLYWNLFDMGPLKFKGLFFGSMENLSIHKRFTVPADNAKIDRGGVITDVSYQLIFCGVGATVAW